MSSEPATNTELSAWCAWLQLNDTFYPTGAYSHSFGLEGLVEAGVIRGRASLRDFLLQSVLPSLARTEFPLVLHLWKALSQGDWIGVERLAELASALRTPWEMRQASEAIGRQRVELLVKLRENALAKEFQTKAAAGGWSYSQSVAVALEGLAVGASVDMALASLLYAAAAGLLAAAMKVLRLGQNAAQSLLTEILDQATALRQKAQSVSLDDIGWSNPWWDIASARHEHAASRLFIS